LPSLYDIYRKPDPWKKDLPADLLPAIEHLRKIFKDNHWSYGSITQKLCYWMLHPGRSEEEVADYLRPLRQLQTIVGPEATKCFVEMLQRKTDPAFFKAYFEIYLDGMTRTALPLFKQFAAIGKANEERLGVPHLKWADEQIKNMIRSEMHVIVIWIRNVCDVQIYDPTEDSDEQIFWRKWRAPMLLGMKPSRHLPYEKTRVWERWDAEASRGFLEAFAVDYVLHIEAAVERLSGNLAVGLAKQPKPPAPPASTVRPDVAPTPESPALSTKTHPKPVSARQEVRKLNTQERYRDWQRAYRSLKQLHPNRTDIWFSKKIAEMDVAKDASPETIRKHMK
jgi:hypothetical protein